MAQNEIDEMFDHLRRIKSGDNPDSVKINLIEKLEMVLKYHHGLLSDSLVKRTQKRKWIVKMLQWVFDGIPDECKTNLNLERLESHLLEFFKVVIDSDFKDTDEEMYYLFDKPPFVLCLIVLVEVEMKKIFLSKLRLPSLLNQELSRTRNYPKDFLIISTVC
ncbi:hypothetical protein KY285_001300 [Solanum tuberosum]|nr:hypothetical protein KY289_001554 [Solanum tuberosum]KAH0765429.1 hypothetical protein KY285_001300 [Solanum tuberosum]